MSWRYLKSLIDREAAFGIVGILRAKCNGKAAREKRDEHQDRGEEAGLAGVSSHARPT